MKIETKHSYGQFTIMLNNPNKLNCIGFDMLNELHEALTIIENDNQIQILIIQGTGDRAFSTGADLKEFDKLNDEDAVRWIEFGNQLFNRIENLPIPTVAVINGYAIGGGVELALACDFRLATSNSTLFCPELQHGWLPGWGGMTRLRRLLGEVRAKEIILRSKKFTAAEAKNIGLITEIIQSENPEQEISAFCAPLLQINPEAYKLAKSALQTPDRKTLGVDLQFDVLAMQLKKQR